MHVLCYKNFSAVATPHGAPVLQKCCPNSATALFRSIARVTQIASFIGCTEFLSVSLNFLSLTEL